jgi:hypothetical protein
MGRLLLPLLVWLGLRDGAAPTQETGAEKEAVTLREAMVEVLRERGGWG